MAAAAHDCWVRFAAALIAAAALLPALHDASSHHAYTTHGGVSLDAAAGASHDALSESCPICLATRSVHGKALRVQPQAPHAKPLSAGPALPPAPLLAGRTAPGTASPRAPPSA